jgi:hypothetical protein
MFKAGISADLSKQLLKVTSKPESFNEAIKSFEYRVCDPYYSKELTYNTAPKTKKSMDPECALTPEDLDKLSGILEDTELGD